MGNEHSETNMRPPFGMVFQVMPEGFCLQVVRTALQHRPQASAGARDRLNGRLRRLNLPGFRDGSRAKPAQLELPVLDRILDGDDRLAGAVLRCWEEASAGLRKVVAAYLADEHIEVCTERRSDHFAATWPEAEWKTHRAKVLEANGDLSFDAVGLMLILQVGKHPLPNLDDVPQVVSPRFHRWLEELDSLLPTAQEWGDAEEFGESVIRLAQAKGAELLLLVFERRKAAVAAVVDGYVDELAYLGIDSTAWKELDGRDPLSEARVAESLAKALAAYRPVRPQAASREVEIKRAVERTRCEEAVLKFAAEWNALPKNAFAAEAEDEDDAEPPVDAGRLAEELAEARAELLRVTVAHSELRENHEEVSEANRGLRLSREQLDGELAELRTELDQRRHAEERWRLAYVEARKLHPARSDAAPEVATVKDAVELAERAFADELVVALNGKSDVGIPFAKPAEVFDALAWLATCYRRPGSPSIAEACPGWFHKPDQTGTTMGRFRQWYETSFGGRNFEVSNHIGKGASFDPKSTIRIGFAWDDQLGRVVVGFVGRHQRTR
ncbi:MAG: hypothetical protein OXU77_17315 [Gammaproteobacteria bacterium]|nr:hypothetical protein [Gammaproteobacteria bacterium]